MMSVKKSDVALALVIGASGGIGSAITAALRNLRGHNFVKTLSRRADGFNITDETSIASASNRFSQQNLRFDLIFNATGILEMNGNPPEKSFAELKADAMISAFSVNSVGPALTFKHFMPLLCRHQRSVFATLSARVGSIGDNKLGGWMSYRASKAALNQIIRCAAIENTRGRPNSIVVGLHPGTIETPLTTKFARGRFTDTPNDAAHKLLHALGGLTNEDNGKFLDYAGNKVDW